MTRTNPGYTGPTLAVVEPPTEPDLLDAELDADFDTFLEQITMYADPAYYGEGVPGRHPDMDARVRLAAVALLDALEAAGDIVALDR